MATERVRRIAALAAELDELVSGATDEELEDHVGLPMWVWDSIVAMEKSRRGSER